jgi:hypothetical protein
VKKVTPDTVGLASYRVDGFPQFVFRASQFGAPGTNAGRIDQANAASGFGACFEHDGLPLSETLDHGRTSRTGAPSFGCGKRKESRRITGDCVWRSCQDEIPERGTHHVTITFRQASKHIVSKDQIC